jgi:CHAT domain-containing protein
VRSIRDPQPIDELMHFGVRDTLRDTVIGWEPERLCGLALAGANLPPKDGVIDGIITAAEIYGLDLSGCDLCVLSACDTKVGVRRGGQHLESLQTALHAAGVKCAITSLWRVRDDAARALMTEFYRRLWRLKEPVVQALWNAKMELKNAKDPNTGKPVYALRDWCGWVLSGDPD